MNFEFEFENHQINDRSRLHIFAESLKSSNLYTAIENAVRQAVESQLSKVIDRIEKCEAQIMDLEITMNHKSKEVTKLKEQVQSQAEAISVLQTNTNNLEQYSRRNCVLVFGVKEEVNEKTDDIICNIASRHLGISLTKGDIDRSHRVQTRRQNKEENTKHGQKGRSKRTPPALPIIVKFTSYRVRSAVLSSRRKLKGTGIGIDENLTRQNAELLRTAKATPGVISAWSSDGRILVLVPTTGGGTMTRLVRSKDDLNRLK